MFFYSGKTFFQCYRAATTYPQLHTYLINEYSFVRYLRVRSTHIWSIVKVIYPKYSKHCLSTVAHTIDCVCSKILNHRLNHGLLFPPFKFFGWKKILNYVIENSRLKSRFLFCLIFKFYMMYRLICQKPAHFLSAQMALVSTFFRMFIVLGICITRASQK